MLGRSLAGTITQMAIRIRLLSFPGSAGLPALGLAGSSFWADFGQNHKNLSVLGPKGVSLSRGYSFSCAGRGGRTCSVGFLVGYLAPQQQQEEKTQVGLRCEIPPCKEELRMCSGGGQLKKKSFISCISFSPSFSFYWEREHLMPS